MVQEYGIIDIHQNPIDAKKYINNTKYDLIIIDIDMNEMSGFEFAKLVKDSFLNFLTPIVFTSNVSDSETIVKCYKYESASFIKRPFTPIVAKTQFYNILKTEALKHSIEREKENFIATLTHDLKSPINAENLIVCMGCKQGRAGSLRPGGQVQSSGPLHHLISSPSMKP